MYSRRSIKLVGKTKVCGISTKQQVETALQAAKAKNTGLLLPPAPRRAVFLGGELDDSVSHPATNYFS
jgi:hypothetical protein